MPVLIIGITAAAHQAWSANIFSTVGDMFPRKAIATITGIGGMAGGVSSFIINKASGVLFDYAVTHGMVSPTCVQPVKVGVLPAKRVYWALPGETTNGSFPASGQVGLLDEAGGAGPRLQ